jgi:hypothetical protein
MSTTERLQELLDKKDEELEKIYEKYQALQQRISGVDWIRMAPRMD